MLKTVWTLCDVECSGKHFGFVIPCKSQNGEFLCSNSSSTLTVVTVVIAVWYFTQPLGQRECFRKCSFRKHLEASSVSVNFNSTQDDTKIW